MVLLLLLVVLASACGGDGGEGEGEAAPTTTTTTAASAAKQRFIEEGDEVCGEAQEALGEIFVRLQEIEESDAPEAQKLPRLARVFGDEIELIDTFRDRFAALEPPPGDEAEMERFLSSLEEGATFLGSIRDALAEGDSDRATDLLPEYAEAVDEGNALARDYGFKVCGATG